ncbi:thermonuclease family protein [Nitrosovibrio tenuis]|nr:thermonuclease family protein [Nitrosovibrio tenuis]
MRSTIIALVFVPLVALPYLVFAGKPAKIIHAQVVQVVDGDSLTVAIDGEMVRVRLAEIDAPEGKQPFTIRSKQSLTNLCLWVPAELSSISKDQYGRTLARVKCEGVDVNAEQVKRGMAWAHGEFTKDPALSTLQEEARSAKRGLWSDKSPTPPWIWRTIHP